MVWSTHSSKAILWSLFNRSESALDSAPYLPFFFFSSNWVLFGIINTAEVSNLSVFSVTGGRRASLGREVKLGPSLVCRDIWPCRTRWRDCLTHMISGGGEHGGKGWEMSREEAIWACGTWTWRKPQLLGREEVQSTVQGLFWISLWHCMLSGSWGKGTAADIEGQCWCTELCST